MSPKPLATSAALSGLLASPAVSESAPQTELSPAPQGEHTVLVVEDQASIRDLLREILDIVGHPVVEAEHGQAALSLLRAGLRPCVILLDLMMPVMDGWQFLGLIRKDPALSSLPVLVLSGADQFSPGLTSMATAVMHKPVDVPRLLDLVAAHCNES